MSAHAIHAERITFHLTGRRGAGLGDASRLRPALMARYRDLATLRHDFPLVLATAGEPAAESLRALVDGALAGLTAGGAADAERTRRQVLRVEQEVRALLQEGARGTLRTLWHAATERLAAARDTSFADTSRRAAAAFAVDGALLGCDATLPRQLLRHLWQRVQQRKEAALRERLVRLIHQLSELLRADFEYSSAGRSATRLEASLGSGLGALFDVDAMSRLLSRAAPPQAMPAARRERIRHLLGVLDTQAFVGLPDADGARAAGHEAYCYVFDSCEAALAAWNERLPRLVALSEAIDMAELEVDGRYDPVRHAALFGRHGASGLDADAASHFPDYLVCLDAGALDAAEQARLMEILAGGLPFKLLLTIDDLLDAPPGQAALGTGVRAHQLAHMAMGLNQAYVLQSAASHLVRCAGRITDGMHFAGPALFSVYTGAGQGAGGQAPYLAAAAAMESRAFPAFVYDPSRGADWASRFTLDGNPQPELDWPVHRFEYEDAQHQRVSEDLAFTIVDFVAADARFSAHFASLAGAPPDEDLAAVDALLLSDDARPPQRVPCVRMIDEADRLLTVVVDDTLLREARRWHQRWHSLQELGGVHNSHAERLLARERAAWEAAFAAPPAAPVVETPAQAQVQPTASPPVAAEAAPSRDDAYIETARCSSCNECTQINPKMFAYDSNQQAFIADLKAGTYAQLVEAAESCQVSVIHPGKPLDPHEPGLDELLARAEPFR